MDEESLIEGMAALAGASFETTFRITLAHGNEQELYLAIAAARARFGGALTLGKIYARHPERGRKTAEAEHYRVYGTLTLSGFPVTIPRSEVVSAPLHSLVDVAAFASRGQRATMRDFETWHKDAFARKGWVPLDGYDDLNQPPTSWAAKRDMVLTRAQLIRLQADGLALSRRRARFKRIQVMPALAHKLPDVIVLHGIRTIVWEDLTQGERFGLLHGCHGFGEPADPQGLLKPERLSAESEVVMPQRCFNRFYDDPDEIDPFV